MIENKKISKLIQVSCQEKVCTDFDESYVQAAENIGSVMNNSKNIEKILEFLYQI